MHSLHGAREEYLRHALTLKKEEVGMIAELSEWLPHDIIDAHTHCCLPEHVIDISAGARQHMLSSFPSFSLKESQCINELMFPQNHVRSLRTTQVFNGLEWAKANEYLLKDSPAEDRIALFGTPEGILYVLERMNNERVAAIKMYYSYCSPPARTIYETFPQEIISSAEKNRVPLLIHPPKMLTQSIDDFLRLKQDFPDIQVCIAHLGLSKFLTNGVEDAFRKIAEQTDFVMDTAMNPSKEVCQLAIEIIGADKIMFGSDMPIGLVRSVPYIHPEKGQRIVADIKYHWQDNEEYHQYGHLAQGATHSHLLALRALRSAIGASTSSKNTGVMKEKIFHDNAEQFYKF